MDTASAANRRTLWISFRMVFRSLVTSAQQDSFTSLV